MSRCFPYRPTLCARNGASGEALIETIKLNCGKDKYKTESLKEKKRERKEKRKERKGKEVNPSGFSDGKVKKFNNERCCPEENNKAPLGEHLSKKSQNEEAERLEKSSLTDEHDEPVCYLSDGTQSTKKKSQPSPYIAPSTTPSITVHRNILRIRLPSLKHRETDASISKGQLYPSVVRAADSLVQRIPVKEQSEITIKVEKARVISDKDSQRKDGIAQIDANPSNRTTLNEEKVPGTESFYKALIEDWSLCPFQSRLNDSDDEDWLFGTTKQRSQEFKRLKTDNDVPCRQSSTLWPCAHHLPEADVYALPYSIPF